MDLGGVKVLKSLNEGISSFSEKLIREALELGIFKEYEVKWLLVVGMNEECISLLRETIGKVKRREINSSALRELKETLPTRTLSILGVISPYYIKHHDILHLEKIYTDCMWPKTVEQAVEVLLAVLPQEEKAKIIKLGKDNLGSLHFGLGMWIRNEFGLWAGNRDLLDDVARLTGLEKGEEVHPDDASDLIIYKLWKKLEETQKWEK